MIDNFRRHIVISLHSMHSFPDMVLCMVIPGDVSDITEHPQLIVMTIVKRYGVTVTFTCGPRFESLFCTFFAITVLALWTQILYYTWLVTDWVYKLKRWVLRCGWIDWNCTCAESNTRMLVKKANVIYYCVTHPYLTYLPDKIWVAFMRTVWLCIVR
jgi:hypothetical protein